MSEQRFQHTLFLVSAFADLPARCKWAKSLAVSAFFSCLWCRIESYRHASFWICFAVSGPPCRAAVISTVLLQHHDAKANLLPMLWIADMTHRPAMHA